MQGPYIPGDNFRMNVNYNDPYAYDMISSWMENNLYRQNARALPGQVTAQYPPANTVQPNFTIGEGTPLRYGGPTSVSQPGTAISTDVFKINPKTGIYELGASHTEDLDKLYKGKPTNLSDALKASKVTGSTASKASALATAKKMAETPIPLISDVASIASGAHGLFKGDTLTDRVLGGADLALGLGGLGLTIAAAPFTGGVGGALASTAAKQTSRAALRNIIKNIAKRKSAKLAGSITTKQLLKQSTKPNRAEIERALKILEANRMIHGWWRLPYSGVTGVMKLSHPKELDYSSTIGKIPTDEDVNTPVVKSIDTDSKDIVNGQDEYKSLDTSGLGPNFDSVEEFIKSHTGDYNRPPSEGLDFSSSGEELKPDSSAKLPEDVKRPSSATMENNLREVLLEQGYSADDIDDWIAGRKEPPEELKGDFEYLNSKKLDDIISGVNIDNSSIIGGLDNATKDRKIAIGDILDYYQGLKDFYKPYDETMQQYLDRSNYNDLLEGYRLADLFYTGLGGMAKNDRLASYATRHNPIDVLDKYSKSQKDYADNQLFRLENILGRYDTANLYRYMGLPEGVTFADPNAIKSLVEREKAKALEGYKYYYKDQLEGTKHKYRTIENAQNIAGRKDIALINNEGAWNRSVLANKVRMDIEKSQAKIKEFELELKDKWEYDKRIDKDKIEEAKLLAKEMDRKIRYYNNRINALSISGGQLTDAEVADLSNILSIDLKEMVLNGISTGNFGQVSPADIDRILKQNESRK